MVQDGAGVIAVLALQAVLAIVGLINHLVLKRNREQLDDVRRRLPSEPRRPQDHDPPKG